MVLRVLLLAASTCVPRRGLAWQYWTECVRIILTGERAVQLTMAQRSKSILVGGNNWEAHVGGAFVVSLYCCLQSTAYRAMSGISLVTHPFCPAKHNN